MGDMDYGFDTVCVSSDLCGGAHCGAAAGRAALYDFKGWLRACPWIMAAFHPTTAKAQMAGDANELDDPFKLD